MQNLDKPNLGGLDHQINALLQTIHQLKVENGQLRNRLANALHTEAELNEKNKRAQEKITTLITRLKEELA